VEPRGTSWNLAIAVIYGDVLHEQPRSPRRKEVEPMNIFLVLPLGRAD